MPPRPVQTWNRLPATAALTVAALCRAGEARASCFTTPARNPATAPRAQLGGMAWPEPRIAQGEGGFSCD